MTGKQYHRQKDLLTNREFLEFIHQLEEELASMAQERGMHTLVPALRQSATVSRNILDRHF